MSESSGSSFETRYANQSIEPLNLSHAEIDERLRSSRTGALVRTKKYGETFLYIGAPPTAELVILERGTFLAYNSDIAKKLCELNSLRIGYAIRWTCKKKENGRLAARCSAFGLPACSSGQGFRDRASKRVNCPAYCNTISAESALEEEDMINLLSALADLIDAFEDETNSSFEILSVISSFDWHHVAHTSLLHKGTRTVFNRVSDVVNNPQLLQDVRRMLDLCGETKGVGIKIRQQLRKKHPEFEFSDSVIRNTIAHIRSDSECAQNFKCTLEAMKEAGQVEYLHLFINSNTKVLDGAVWSYAGARNVVSRCNDLLFWDSTHNVTRFLYRLASFTLVDSEGRNRPVLFSLALSETAESCKQVLACWHNAFNSKLPNVIFTDGDDSMHAAIASVPYSEDLHHLLCLFHLFDLNVKKNMMPLLQATSNGNGSQWELFRKGLSMCQQARTEEQFEDLWEKLLKEWVPTSRQGNKVRKYLHSYVYNTRYQWATCFFPKAFTLGHSTTQRSESWNNLIKKGSKVHDMVELVTYIETLCAEHRSFEIKKQESTHVQDAFKRVPLVHDTALLSEILSIGLSSYAARQLATEIGKAEVLRFCTDGELQIECSGENSSSPVLHAQGITQYAYSCGSSNGNTEYNRTQVSIKITHDENHPITADCECNYMYRMKLPCRHVLAVALSIDKDGEKIAQCARFVQNTSLLILLIRNLVDDRWLFPDRDVHSVLRNRIVPQNPIPGPSLSDDSELQQWHESGGMSLDAVLTPKSTTKQRRVTYAVLRSNFSALADNVTKIRRDGNAAEFLSNFVKSLSNRLTSATEELNEHRVREVFQHAMNDTFNTDTNLNTDLCSGDEFFAEIDPVEQKVSGMDTSQSMETQEIRPQRKRQKVFDPPRRADTRFAGGANSLPYKSRDSRRKRTAASRSVPPKMRGADQEMIEIPKKLRSAGYACPFCSSLKVQNNAQNVMQHIRAKHKDRTVPSITELREAALHVTGNEEAPSMVPDSSKELNAETLDIIPEKKQDHDLHEDNLLQKILPGTATKYRMPTKKWRVKTTTNVFQARTVVGLLCGDTIDIFDATDARWRAYTIVEKRDQTFCVRNLSQEGSTPEIVDLNNSSLFWILRRKCLGSPKPHLYVDQDTRERFAKTIRKCESDPDYEIRTWSGTTVPALDYVRLRPKKWLDDSVVTAFIQCMALKSVNPSNHRFAVIDSLVWDLLQRKENAELARVLTGLPPYTIDFLLSPVNVQKSHWMLCVINVHERTIALLDPYDPATDHEHFECDNIRAGIGLMFDKYDSEYNIKQGWKIVSAEPLVKKLNLPIQPAENNTDCGVLVCMYSWAILTDTAWPLSSRRGRGIDLQFENMRTFIGCTIMK